MNWILAGNAAAAALDPIAFVFALVAYKVSVRRTVAIRVAATTSAAILFAVLSVLAHRAAHGDTFEATSKTQVFFLGAFAIFADYLVVLAIGFLKSKRSNSRKNLGGIVLPDPGSNLGPATNPRLTIAVIVIWCVIWLGLATEGEFLWFYDSDINYWELLTLGLGLVVILRKILHDWIKAGAANPQISLAHSDSRTQTCESCGRINRIPIPHAQKRPLCGACKQPLVLGE